MNPTNIGARHQARLARKIRLAWLLVSHVTRRMTGRGGLIHGLNGSHSMMLGTKLARDQSKNSVGTADVCLVRLPPWASHSASRVIEAAS